MTDSVEIKGLKELQLMLATLPEKVGRQGLQSGVAAATMLIRDRAKELAPQYTGKVADGHPPPGTLKKSIIAKRVNERCSTYRQVYIVTARKGKTKTKGGKEHRKFDAYYASWVEYGHFFVPRGKAKNKTSLNSLKDRREQYKSKDSVTSGAHYILPQPFMRPAFNEKLNPALEAFTGAMRKKIEDAIK